MECVEKRNCPLWKAALGKLCLSSDLGGMSHLRALWRRIVARQQAGPQFARMDACRWYEFDSITIIMLRGYVSPFVHCATGGAAFRK